MSYCRKWILNHAEIEAPSAAIAHGKGLTANDKVEWTPDAKHSLTWGEDKPEPSRFCSYNITWHCSSWTSLQKVWRNRFVLDQSFANRPNARELELELKTTSAHLKFCLVHLCTPGLGPARNSSQGQDNVRMKCCVIVQTRPLFFLNSFLFANRSKTSCQGIGSSLEIWGERTGEPTDRAGRGESHLGSRQPLQTGSPASRQHFAEHASSEGCSRNTDKMTLTTQTT